VAETSNGHVKEARKQYEAAQKKKDIIYKRKTYEYSLGLIGAGRMGKVFAHTLAYTVSEVELAAVGY
jgi:hypothetical protein